MARTGLIVDDANLILARFGIDDAIETVDDATNLHAANLGVYPLFEVDDTERRKAAVDLEQQSDVLDDDLAIDELQAIEWWQRARGVGNLEELLLDGLVDGTFDGDFFFEQLVEHHRGDGVGDKRRVDDLGGLVEDITEQAVVDHIILGAIGLGYLAHIAVEESQLATQIGVDGRRADAALFIRKVLLHLGDDIGRLLDGLGGVELWRLARFQGEERDGNLVLDHQLEHKARHLGRLAIAGSIVVEYGDIGCALQQAMEIVLIDGHLVIDGGQAVGLTKGVGNERGVVDAARHVALVARKQQHVVEVEVTRFEYAHHLDTFGGFAVEGDGGRRNELTDKALHGDDVYLQHAAINQSAQPIK